MKLYVDPSVTLDTLDGIAAGMGITTYNDSEDGVRVRGKYRGKRAVSFVLRPLTDRYRLMRRSPWHGRRRVWAVCWHAHRDFMRAVFALDPTAVFVTGLDTWNGSEDFEARHAASAHRNIGSMAYPLAYGDACETHEAVEVEPEPVTQPDRVPLALAA